MPADSLRCTSALTVILAFVFLVITVYIDVFKLVKGSIGMPRLLPDITDINSAWKLFTIVRVLVAAYVYHFNVSFQFFKTHNPLASGMHLDKYRKKHVHKSMLKFDSTPILYTAEPLVYSQNVSIKSARLAIKATGAPSSRPKSWVPLHLVICVKTLRKKFNCPQHLTSAKSIKRTKDIQRCHDQAI
ncbi:unnamed protein product [Fraxinus pennsylvanica]|uniref:Uncharacterized protein n=1 Tax=Fraxinus pennsylvanica TaxID=56036 RepID=A0AAD2ECB3_9LAMI|nr:unnamed protein product [Fraxinus pennsylvanica]